MLILLSTLMLLDAALQVRPLPQMTVPQGERPVVAAHAATARRELADLPDAMIDFGRPRGWTEPDRSDGGVALTAERHYRLGNRGDCATWYDRIDLSRVRANGFALVGWSAAPLASPPGHVESSPVEAIPVVASAPDLFTADYRAAEALRIRPPISIEQGSAQAGGLACFSGYRLTITVEGPIGRDPLARPLLARPLRSEPGEPR